MSEPSLTFAEAFERLRLARGWKPAEVARRLGVYPTEVSRWRHGRGGISIRNVRKIADLFGVDRAEMERLAGYSDRSTAVAGSTINPEIAVMLDADRADLLTELQNVPPPLWAIIFVSQRAGRRLAIDAIRAARALAQPHEPAISTSEIGPLACTCLFCRPGASGSEGGPSDTLAILLALPLAG